MTASPSPSAFEHPHARQLLAEVGRVFMGSVETVEGLIVALLAGGHVLLEGVPGVAKTTLAKTFASALGLTMRRIQFTPDLLPADITGSYVLSPRDGTFSLRPGPVFANIVLADEINRAPAKTQSALLEAMQERQVTIEGERMPLPQPFMVIATQNPIEMEGTYPLPEAQLDRFLLRVAVPYPTFQEEVEILRAHASQAPQVQAILSREVIVQLQAAAHAIHVEPDLLEYAVALASHTRGHRSVLLGASPRGTLSLLQAAKARAALRGRPYLAPDDLQAMAGPVLGHRLVLNVDAEQPERARLAVVRDAIANVGFRKELRRG